MNLSQSAADWKALAAVVGGGFLTENITGKNREVKLSRVPFFGQRTTMSREEAIERYILLRLRFEDIRRLGFLVEGLHARTIQLPSGSPFTHFDLKDTARTAFFGWFATLTDKDGKAVYAFDPLFVLFPDKRYQIGLVQMECEACHGVLHRFRGNVAFHSRAEVAAQIKARQALIQEDTFLDLESARQDCHRLMTVLIADELKAIPELPEELAKFGVSHHPAFANVSAVSEATARSGSAFLSCEVLD